MGFEILSILLVNEHQVQVVPHLQPVIDVLVRWGQLYPHHVHSNRNHLPFHRTPIHHLELYQSLGLGFILGVLVSECLFSHYWQLHTLYPYLNQLEWNLTLQTVLEVVMSLVIRKFDMKTILDTDLHLDWNIVIFFQLGIGNLNGEVNLFDKFGVIVSVDGYP